MRSQLLRSRCGRCGAVKESTIHDVESANSEIRHAAHEFQPPSALERLIDVVAQVSHSVGISETMPPEQRVCAMRDEIERLRAALERRSGLVDTARRIVAARLREQAEVYRQEVKELGPRTPGGHAIDVEMMAAVADEYERAADLLSGVTDA